jgi:hypothetical protein
MTSLTQIPLKSLILKIHLIYFGINLCFDTNHPFDLCLNKSGLSQVHSGEFLNNIDDIDFKWYTLRYMQ